MRKSTTPAFGMGMSLSAPSLSVPVGEWIRSLLGQYQLRHDLMKQVKAPGNAQALNKLRKLFRAD